MKDTETIQEVGRLLSKMTQFDFFIKIKGMSFHEFIEDLARREKVENDKINVEDVILSQQPTLEVLILGTKDFINDGFYTFRVGRNVHRETGEYLKRIKYNVDSKKFKSFDSAYETMLIIKKLAETQEFNRAYLAGKIQIPNPYKNEKPH